MREKNNKFSKRFSKREKIIFYCLVVVIMLLSIPAIVNPMRRPAPLIRLHVLWNTPIGMNMEEVIEIIENNERWGSPIINRDSGFVHPSPWVHGASGTLIVGEQSIQIRHIYSIPLFLDRTVRILWGFDENGKLIEVYVESWFVS